MYTAPGVVNAECLYDERRYIECRYAKCHYIECRYGECCGANERNEMIKKEGIHQLVQGPVLKNFLRT